MSDPIFLSKNALPNELQSKPGMLKVSAGQSQPKIGSGADIRRLVPGFDSDPNGALQGLYPEGRSCYYSRWLVLSVFCFQLKGVREMYGGVAF